VLVLIIAAATAKCAFKWSWTYWH